MKKLMTEVRLKRYAKTVAFGGPFFRAFRSGMKDEAKKTVFT